jgi:hypothetical protein
MLVTQNDVIRTRTLLMADVLPAASQGHASARLHQVM